MAIQELLNVRETARRLGVSEATVRNWSNRGVLRPSRLPGSGFRRFDARQIERVQHQMFTQLAPTDEGLVLERAARGRIVRADELGDDD
jgi:DNA-binding transcriptional MerR regulator